MKRKIAKIIYSSPQYDSFFNRLGFNTDLDYPPDLVVFTGGSDVSPKLYNQSAHPTTTTNWARDVREMEVFNHFSQQGIPCVGICRGSQFLCVMNGGSLIQHVSNHAIYGTHEAKTHDGRTIEVTSTHHQMMYPNGGEPYILLAWAEGLSHFYQGGDKDFKVGKDFKEPEVVLWPEDKCLGFQGHPEYMPENSNAVEFFAESLKFIL